MTPSFNGRIGASILFTVLLLTASAAQPVRLSVRSAVAAALRSHGSVQIAQERVSAAEADLDQTGAMLLPKLQLTGRAIALSEVEQGKITVTALPGSPSIPLFPVITHSYAARLQLTQPLFTGFRLSNAKEIAVYSVEAAQAELSYDRSDLALQTERAYWSWVQAREARDVLKEVAGQMKAHEERVANMSAQGLVRRADVLAIRAKRAEVEVEAVEADTRASTAMMHLNFLTGLALDTELEPSDTPADAIPMDGAPEIDVLTRTAEEQRADLASARLRTEMARASVSMANAGWYPNISFAAAYEYANPQQRIIPPKDRFDGSWEIGVTFQWTVWDWMTTSSQADRAEAVRRQAETGYELMRQGVRLEVTQLSRKAEDSKRKLGAAALSRDAAAEALRVMDEQFTQGLSTSVDVNDARIDLLRARLAYTRAAADAAIADAELRHAIGGAQ